MFKCSELKSHAGLTLKWKIICDSLTEEDWDSLAQLVVSRYDFKLAVGVPQGGLAFASALNKYAKSASVGLPVLIVDDVLTTGGSMEEMKRELAKKYNGNQMLGVVLFSRGQVPVWVRAIFTLSWPFEDKK